MSEIRSIAQIREKYGYFILIHSESSQDTNENHDSIEIENNIEVSTENCEQSAIIPNVENPIESKLKYKKNIQKNHICQYCGRAFPSVSLLTTHNRIHTGER